MAGPIGQPLARQKALAFHGDITMYGSAEGKRGKNRWVEYRVRFTRGRVEWIRPERGRRRSLKRKTSSRPRWPDGERGPLVPGIDGRRLTGDEFSRLTPEKLELIEGRIPGDEQLLMLILTSVGLRYAVELLGAEQWQQAVEAARL